MQYCELPFYALFVGEINFHIILMEIAGTFYETQTSYRSSNEYKDGLVKKK